MNYVFLNNQLVNEYDPSDMTLPELGNMAKRCPMDSYIYNSQQRHWYWMQGTAVSGSYSKAIPEHYVPTWAKALLLLIT